jgi:hypothetical protein
MTESRVSRRGLRVKAVSLAAFLALATAGLVGCGGSSAPAGSVAEEPSVTSLLSDEAAFRAFREAMQRYDHDFYGATGGPLLNEASCGIQLPPSVESAGKVAVVTVGFDSLLKSKKAAPAYQELAQKLDAIPTENAGLKKVAAAVNLMSRNVAPALKKADIHGDFCTHLKRWEADDWSDSYYRELTTKDPFSTYGIDERKFREASDQLTSAGADLEKIPGVTPDEALEITGGARLICC